MRLLDLGNRWHGAGSHHDAAVSDSLDGNASCWQADREHRREAYSAERRRSEAHRTDNRQRSNDARKPHECDEVVEVEVERVGLRGEGVTPQGCPEWQLLPDKPKGLALPLIEVRVGAAREPRGPEGDPFHRSPSQWRPARSAVACALFLRPRVLLYGGRLNMGEV